jgi:hypothetical protein
VRVEPRGEKIENVEEIPTVKVYPPPITVVISLAPSLSVFNEPLLSAETDINSTDPNGLNGLNVSSLKRKARKIMYMPL